MDVDAVRPLRAAILRPGQPPDAVVWPGDDDPRAGHYAIADLAIGSVMPEGPGWRVRGMATTPEARGRGHGAAILEALLDHVRDAGGGLVWCHAREPAVPLYERAGFAVVGEPYEMPGIGPHRRMELEVVGSAIQPEGLADRGRRGGDVGGQAG